MIIGRFLALDKEETCALVLVRVVWLWRRCLLMKFWPLMRASHDLQTHLYRNKDTTGNHSKICITKSSGSTSLVVNIAFVALISWVTKRKMNDQQTQR